MKITNLSKSFNNVDIFKNASFEFENGKITYIMGKSGIGKTTLLKIIAGLDKIYTGIIDKVEKLAYVFQEPRLFPSLTIKENVKIVNPNSKYSIKDVLDIVELSDYENMYPNELSGGMKARVSIARAIFYDADVVLMDEPFASIDENMKNRIAPKIFKELKNKTVIVVSHDLSEAKIYSDKIISI